MYLIMSTYIPRVIGENEGKSQKTKVYKIQIYEAKDILPCSTSTWNSEQSSVFYLSFQFEILRYKRKCMKKKEEDPIN